MPKWHTPAELTSSLQTWKVIAFCSIGAKHEDFSSDGDHPVG